MIKIREDQQGKEEQLTNEQILSRVLGTKRGFNPVRGRVSAGNSSSSSSLRSHPAPAPPITQAQMAAMAKYVTTTQQHVMTLYEQLAERNIIDLPRPPMLDPSQFMLMKKKMRSST
ncbi:hypothetical protein CTI12_AA436490 [Artemisia annua]|uniref:Uncharacterized protein n=1 Tax=Artemisia annua TaxID=35608 RepID=A0A2U1LYL8_ARTAN|nr:hypothetical protein CTI12_AA436490 [Artemisia annua]